MSSGGVRVAIMGVGPTGVRAAERLASHGAHLAHRDRFHIDVFGADRGSWGALDPGQPDYLRVSIPADEIDAWYREGAAPAGPERLSLAQWLPTSGYETLFDRYPPRALVGQYLEDCWQIIQERLPVGWTLSLRGRPGTVRESPGGGWLIDGTRYDECYRARDLRADTDGVLASRWRGAWPLVQVSTLLDPALSRDVLPGGAALAVHGAGEAFLDALLAVTRGRGGRFEPALAVNRMRYRRSGDDAAVVYPFSSAGRFGVVRPDRRLLPGLELQEVAAGVLRGLDGAGDSAAIRAAVSDVAARLLVRARSDIDAVLADALVEESLGAVAEAGEPGREAVRLLETSVDVALGQRPPEAEWALGVVWLAVRPFLNEPTVRELDLLVDGPSPLVAIKLLALIEAGVVDPRSLGGGATITPDGIHWPAGMPMPLPEVDAVVDGIGSRALPMGVREPLLEGDEARRLDRWAARVVAG